MLSGAANKAMSFADAEPDGQPSPSAQEEQRMLVSEEWWLGFRPRGWAREGGAARAIVIPATATR
jgi:hypothetical protein